eukprot:CAMPEP_0113315594 /NCGR_PEP_ID=MMETSP0010_2-20120614/11201_1 /TAXON_ID=216773 ORGANISM="Corethron hystrix, Strain 308" /NCGR_SAMPLE_ID=MMETSP0010_2 /ASSEMBLY_ACC=CAM_ASM_000155 /LENGTH=327 /DNA_ID=CAMNT_0000172129 /DNA_START=386 /DNA_END=1369 /DNA_ORIENTATION=- /assembly_acc=CAM_ASM_000155
MSGGGDTITNSGSTENLETVSPPSVSEARTKSSKMVSVFDPGTESEFDRYAAALAATEPLRVNRDRIILTKIKQTSFEDLNSKTMWPVVQLCERIKGCLTGFSPESRKAVGGIVKESTNLCTPEICDGDPEIRAACTSYALQSSRITRGLGLSVAQFNNISRKVAVDAELKERVMQQAYLYRVAAALKLEKVPLIEDPTSVELLNSHHRQRAELFAQSLVEIEELRTDQTEALKRSLHIKDFPRGVSMCDPSILPLLSPKVKAVCNAFPLQAEEIVKKYGLNSDEFNKMLAETKSNPIFRSKVGQLIENVKGLCEKDSKLKNDKSTN